MQALPEQGGLIYSRTLSSEIDPRQEFKYHSGGGSHLAGRRGTDPRHPRNLEGNEMTIDWDHVRLTALTTAAG
jgi:hypothetical protein